MRPNFLVLLYPAIPDHVYVTAKGDCPDMDLAVTVSVLPNRSLTLRGAFSVHQGATPAASIFHIPVQKRSTAVAVGVMEIARRMRGKIGLVRKTQPAPPVSPPPDQPPTNPN